MTLWFNPSIRTTTGEFTAQYISRLIEDTGVDLAMEHVRQDQTTRNSNVGMAATAADPTWEGLPIESAMSDSRMSDWSDDELASQALSSPQEDVAMSDGHDDDASVDEVGSIDSSDDKSSDDEDEAEDAEGAESEDESEQSSQEDYSNDAESDDEDEEEVDLYDWRARRLRVGDGTDCDQDDLPPIIPGWVLNLHPPHRTLNFHEQQDPECQYPISQARHFELQLREPMRSETPGARYEQLTREIERINVVGVGRTRAQDLRASGSPTLVRRRQAPGVSREAYDRIDFGPTVRLRPDSDGRRTPESPGYGRLPYGFRPFGWRSAGQIDSDGTPLQALRKRRASVLSSDDEPSTDGVPSPPTKKRRGLFGRITRNDADDSEESSNANLFGMTSRGRTVYQEPPPRFDRPSISSIDELPDVNDNRQAPNNARPPSGKENSAAFGQTGFNQSSRGTQKPSAIETTFLGRHAVVRDQAESWEAEPSHRPTPWEDVDPFSNEAMEDTGAELDEDEIKGILSKIRGSNWKWLRKH